MYMNAYSIIGRHFYVTGACLTVAAVLLIPVRVINQRQKRLQRRCSNDDDEIVVLQKTLIDKPQNIKI